MPIVDDIKSRIDILDVVSQYVQLQHSGRSYKAVCPFHNEKTPSFFVFPERQSWRCFGACATGGDMFNFLMRMENLDFSEALKKLAPQAGVSLAETRVRKGEYDALYQINEAAREFFGKLLTSGKPGAFARDYVQKRGITQETIEKFQLGLSPSDGRSLKEHLASKGYAQEQSALAGLINEGPGGEYRDLFRRRLMFPIHDGEGRLIGFGGRSLDDSNPKYLNSPKTPVFDKSRVLYPLHLSGDTIRNQGAVIVEGYMDAIMAHQHGFTGVVASLGTALTQHQVSQVSGLVRHQGSGESRSVVLALDPDAAGQEATLRSLESSWNVFQSRVEQRSSGTGIYGRPEVPSLKVASLPEGRDPDEIIRENSEEWANLMEKALPLIDYLFGALSSRLDLTSANGKARMAELIFPLITATPDPFQQDHYFQRLASFLEVSEATLRASLGRARPRRAAERAGRSPQGQGSKSASAPSNQQAASMTPFAHLEHDPLEEYCLTQLLQNPDLARTPESLPTKQYGLDPSDQGGTETQGGEVSDLRLEYFRRVENREIFTNWMKCSTLELLKGAVDEELKGHLDYLASRILPPANPKQREEGLRYCIRRLEERYLRELNIEEEFRLSQAAPEERDSQEQKIVDVAERLRRVLK